MTAIICIALGVLFFFFVIGRGPGKTAAQTEMVARRAASATPVLAKAGVHKAVDITSTAKDKVSVHGHNGLIKGKAAASVTGSTTKLVAQATGSTVRGALRNMREQYRETKAASHN